MYTPVLKDDSFDNLKGVGPLPCIKKDLAVQVVKDSLVCISAWECVCGCGVCVCVCWACVSVCVCRLCALEENTSTVSNAFDVRSCKQRHQQITDASLTLLLRILERISGSQNMVSSAIVFFLCRQSRKYSGHANTPNRRDCVPIAFYTMALPQTLPKLPNKPPYSPKAPPNPPQHLTRNTPHTDRPLTRPIPPMYELKQHTPAQLSSKIALRRLWAGPETWASSIQDSPHSLSIKQQKHAHSLISA